MSEKQKKKNNVLEIAFEFILYLIIIACVIIIIRIIIFQRYDIFGYRAYIIGSGSMEPAICKNDVILVKQQGDYQQGDIVAYMEENVVYAHRIVEKYSQEENFLYRTKGDNNNVADMELITQSQIQGKVVKIIPGIRKIVETIQKNFIIVGVALIAMATLIIVRRLITNEKSGK